MAVPGMRKPCVKAAAESLYFYLPHTTSLSLEEASWPEVARAGVSEVDSVSPQLVLQKPPPKSQVFTFLDQK